MSYLPNEIVNIVFSYVSSPTANLIKNEWLEIKRQVEISKSGFDDDIVNKSVSDGFWSVINAFDGDISYKNMHKNWATKCLYNTINATEYLQIKTEAIEDDNWSEKMVIVDGLLQRLNIV